MAQVMLFTDEPVLATGFAQTLASGAELKASPICMNLAELPAQLAKFHPEVLLIDWAREVTFGMLAELQRDAPATNIILWVRSIPTELAYQALEVGVRGILRKTLPVETLLKCLRRVAEGELWFDKSLTSSFLTAKTVALTKRESQLVNLLAQGLKNKEIAAALSISEGTVKVYFSRLFQKLRVKDRFELALYGLRNLQIGCPEPVKTEDEGCQKKPVQMQRLRSLVLDKPSDGMFDQFSAWGARS